MKITGKKISLKEKADLIREDVLKISIRNGAGHIAPSLSCVDILTALHYSVISYDPKNTAWEERDRLIFSKAHGCYALYAILADLGVIPKNEWEGFYTEKSSLLGCMERRLEYGLEAGCGSLGHGLPIAVGIAYGAKLQGKKYHIFCLLGDGEMQEGSVWEAIQFAVKHELNNLTIVIDQNYLQAMDFVVNVLDREKRDLFSRLSGFGLFPIICAGQDAEKLSDCINRVKNDTLDVPGLVIAETIKGYGLKCMENVPKFHFRVPSEEEIKLGKSNGCDR